MAFSPAPWIDARYAAALFALDPLACRGLRLRAAAGPARDAWLSQLQQWLPAGTAWRRLPLSITEGRLLGGLDLAASLQAGQMVAERGLLVEADGGVLLVPMAERMPVRLAAHLSAVLDTQQVRLERDGLARCHAARVAVVLLDEAADDEEAPPAALLDRLALQVDLHNLSSADLAQPRPNLAVADARRQLPQVQQDDSIIDALCATATALGVDSLRAPLQALHVARCAAALAGRNQVTEDDAALAARWVLAPRATVLPTPSAPPQESAEVSDELPPDASNPDSTDSSTHQSADHPTHDDVASAAVDPSMPTPDSPPDLLPQSSQQPLQERVLAAAQSALPAQLLLRLQSTGSSLVASKSSGGGRAGALRAAASQRGRPAGVRRGDPRRGARLHLLETLRAAAPWQPLRRRQRHTQQSLPDKQSTTRHKPALQKLVPPRIEVRAEDFRISRYQQRSRTTTVFVVDASGSAALHRLAEAKGAVELLLADCYVRRDQVALIAFRGQSAEAILPPTRSLARAKRCLASLPGGGGTPLAAGLDATAQLVQAIQRRGETALVVLLTDGRANIALDGSPGRARAEQDALATARKLRVLQSTVLLIDTSAYPNESVQMLAQALAARYLPLPYADAKQMSTAVTSAVAAATASSARAA